LLVFLPARTRQIGPRDALYREHFELLDQLGAALELVAVRVQRRGILINVGGQKVGLDDVLQEIEPEDGKLRENLAYARDAGRENDVESRDAIRCDNQELVS
jgi:hypothetical protein